MFFLLLTLLGAATAFAQTGRTACEVSGSAAEAMRALPAITDMSLPWERRMGPRRELSRREPSNWPLQIAMQEPILRLFHLGEESDDAIAFYRAMPDRTLGELLEGRLIAGLHRKRSRELLNRAGRTANDSPWFHLAMLEWAADRMHGDASLADSHFEQFRKLCPSSDRAFLHLDWVRDSGRLAGHVMDLRRLIDGRRKQGLRASDLRLFRPAWTWEGVAAGEKDAARFQAAVRSDLNAIRALALYEDSEWTSVMNRPTSTR